jgi:TonB-dependent receptor
VAYDFTDPNLSPLTLYTTTQLSSPTRYTAGTQVTAIDTFTKPLATFTVLDAVDTTKAYTGRLVLSRETQFLGADATFKAGFQFDQRTKVVDENLLTLDTAAQFSAAGIPTDYNQFSLDTAFMGKIQPGYTFRYFDTAKMRAASAAARKVGTFVPQIANIYNVREQVFAGFLMGTLRYDWGSIVGGARVEHVKNRGIATGITAEAEQTLVFPSLHVNYNLDDTKKVRLSLNTGAARADYDLLRPNVVINDTNETISGGNPAVKPERAWGLDGYFEWYVKPQGYLMVGVFYKHVTDVLHPAAHVRLQRAEYRCVRPFGLYLLGHHQRRQRRIYGMEAAAQFQLEPWAEQLGIPSWMGGFGISANVTVNNSKVSKPAVYDTAGALLVPAARCACRTPRTSFTTSAVTTKSTASRCGSSTSGAASGWTASPIR